MFITHTHNYKLFCNVAAKATTYDANIPHGVLV